MLPPSHGGDPGDSAPCPAPTLGPQTPEILLVTVVHHLRVSPRAELRVVPEELLVAVLEEVALGVVESREDLRVDLPVSVPQLPVEVWPALTGELAVEDEDLPASLTLRAEDRLGGERRGWQKGGEESVLLAMLPALGSCDVATTELETVAGVQDPEHGDGDVK